MCRHLECNYPPARVAPIRVCSQCHFLGTCWFTAKDKAWCFRCIAFVVMRTLTA